MNVDRLMKQAKSVVGPSRVFGEPRECDGVTVIPVAKVSGGGGAGLDESTDGRSGGGFGVRARPAGALVIHQNGSVRWKVPFDLNRVILGGQMLGVAFFFFSWLTERSKARAAAKATIATAVINRRTS